MSVRLTVLGTVPGGFAGNSEGEVGLFYSFAEGSERATLDRPLRSSAAAAVQERTGIQDGQMGRSYRIRGEL